MRTDPVRAVSQEPLLDYSPPACAEAAEARILCVLLKPPLRLVRLGELLVVERQRNEVLLDLRQEQGEVCVSRSLDLRR